MLESKATSPQDPLSISDIGRSIRRHPRSILAVTAVGGVFRAVVVYVLPATYTTTVALVPQSGQTGGLSGAAAVASQFGLQLPTGDPGQSPAFYARLLATRDILGSVYDTVVSVARGDRDLRRAMDEIVDDSQESAPLRRVEGIRRLAKMTYADLDQSTAIIVVSVKTHSATLSYFVANALLNAINQHQQRSRQAIGELEREFYEQRVTDASAALRAAEDAAVQFEAHNRAFLSPELQATKERLAREVSRRQSLYLSLTQNFDQARIDVLHQAPNISIVDRPDFRYEADRKRTLFKAIIAGLIAFLLSTSIFIILDARAGLVGHSAQRRTLD